MSTERLQPRYQLDKVERLRHVIVRASAQAAHPIVDRSPCRQHDDRGRLLTAQVVQCLVAIHPGQHQVRDNGIVVELQCVMQAITAVCCGVH